MNFEWFVSLRYLRAKRKQTFISIISFISIAGVMVGVMALIVVLGVMTGFTEDLKGKILGLNAHIVVQKFGDNVGDWDNVGKRMEQVPGVVATTPFIYSPAMINSPAGASGIVLRGLDVNSSMKVISLYKYIQKGSFRSLGKPVQKDMNSGQEPLPGIIMGKELSRNLAVTTGDPVQVVSPMGVMTPAGMVPQLQSFVVVGIFESGMFEYDSSMAFVSLSEAQRFLGMGQSVTGIEVKVSDIYKADQIASLISKKLGYPYWIRDWMRLNRNLFSALKLEKVAMFIILTLIVMVAAFNIASTLIMTVMEKTKDIAILKSMGATRNSIMKIFVIEGLIVGFSGTVLGIIGGLGLSSLLKKYQFIKLPSDVYYISTLPVRIEVMDVFLISLAAVLVSFLATLYPSWQASKLEPAPALRYE